MSHEVELEDEVADWLDSLDDREFGAVEFHIDRLAQRGHMLGEPAVKHLGDGLRELRFYLGRTQQRISFWIRPDAVIVLLTVFRKTKPNERREVARAHEVMDACKREHGLPSTTPPRGKDP